MIEHASTDHVPDVDFVINVFERTYRDVLQPGQIEARVVPHRFPFKKRVVIINNVNSRDDAEMRLAPLLISGEITEFYYVEDRIEETLQSAGLSRSDIANVVHYNDFALVAVFLPGSPYLVHSDAEVHLLTPDDWITPALHLMRADRRIAVANPNWTSATLQAETREEIGEFALGYGFTDQIFLLERKEFARPIYRHWVPVSWRYPLSHVGPIFEQRVDSYMRRHERLRATSISVHYEHRSEEGQEYSSMSFGDRLLRKMIIFMVKLCQLLPGDDPRYHV